MHNTEYAVVSDSNNFLTVPSSINGVNVLWWEEPLDEFVEMLQDLHKKHAPYFSAHEMEKIYNDVYCYTYQRGKLWEDQINMGVSPEYVQYLANDLVGYLRHIYRFLNEDILDRRGNNTEIPTVMGDDEAEVMLESTLA